MKIKSTAVFRKIRQRFSENCCVYFLSKYCNKFLDNRCERFYQNAAAKFFQERGKGSMENYPYAKFELLTSPKYPGVVFIETLGKFTPVDEDCQILNLKTGELYWFDPGGLTKFYGDFSTIRPMVQRCKRHSKITWVRLFCRKWLKNHPVK